MPFGFWTLKRIGGESMHKYLRAVGFSKMEGHNEVHNLVNKLFEELNK